MIKLVPFLLAASTLFAQNALDKTQLESYLRHMEMWIPQVEVSIDDPAPSKYLPGFSEVAVHLSYNGQGKDELYYVSADGKNIVKGQVFNIEQSPFQANLDRLHTDQQPSYGSDSAPVKLVVFGDFQCPYCKAEAEVMRTNLLPTFGDEVQVFFKDFPLESIHPWAHSASVVGRCVYRQGEDAFWKFHDWIYMVQSEINGDNLNERVTAWAGENGVDPVQLGRCVDTKATDGEIAQNVTEGLALGVSATPTLFINGRKLEGTMQWPVLQQLVAMEIEHQNSAAEAQ